MTLVFDVYELDSARRELRVDGVVQPLQPQVFELLAYLVEHRDRVVPKSELLDELWPHVVVTESSLQRAVSLARSALGAKGAELIQTYPKQGYRFMGSVRTDPELSSEPTLVPRYAKSGDVHIAYSTIGAGRPDIVIVNGWIMPMRAMFQHPGPRSALEAISQIGRVIIFDKRGTGLSDRVKELPSHEQRMDDLRAVLDACGSEQAILIGISEGGALAMLCAATYPERVRGLVLCGAFARMTQSADYPWGYAAEEMDKLKGYIREAWGKGASLRAIAPSQLRDPSFVRWVAFAEQEGSSPGGALDLLEMNLRLDLRELLPSIRVPTVVMQAADDKMIHPGNGPFLATHLRGARYVESPGDDHVFFFRNREEIRDSVRWILAETTSSPTDDRFLSTALVAHVHGNADVTAWTEEVRRFRGHLRGTGWSAYFDGPIRALHCGTAVANRTAVSCGVHIGELVGHGPMATGPAFAVAEALAAKAPRGSVWSSHVVADLVPGSDLRFLDTGQQLEAQGRPWSVLEARRHR